MKAQIAMIEVFLSSLILSAMTSLAVTVSYSMSLQQGDFKYNMQNVFYDFTGAIYNNASESACMLFPSKSCISTLLANINLEYQLDGSQLSINNKSIAVGQLGACSAEKTECFPVNKNSTFVLACLTICG